MSWRRCCICVYHFRPMFSDAYSDVNDSCVFFLACEVCNDKSTGKHYGVFVCDGCSGFFKRSVRRSIPWVCRSNGKCVVDKASRTECRACRFNKCLVVNMNPEGQYFCMACVCVCVCLPKQSVCHANNSAARLTRTSYSTFRTVI